MHGVSRDVIGDLSHIRVISSAPSNGALCVAPPQWPMKEPSANAVRSDFVTVTECASLRDHAIALGSTSQQKLLPTCL
jgi:hypothetical protein